MSASSSVDEDFQTCIDIDNDDIEEGDQNTVVVVVHHDDRRCVLCCVCALAACVDDWTTCDLDFVLVSFLRR